MIVENYEMDRSMMDENDTEPEFGDADYWADLAAKIKSRETNINIGVVA